jgi:protein-S-isoprenylcysteine O-methyltransferase Ste14
MRAGYPLVRHLILLLVIPFVLAVLVPLWLAREFQVGLSAPSGFGEAVLLVLGASLAVGGLILYVWSVVQIATRRDRPLALWDPPRQLVPHGPYRFVRNPVNSGVIFVLFGEALVLESVPHLLWAVAFWVASLVYIPVLEEPQLEARFGDDYRRYRRHVPRFLPRLSPWKPDGE